MRKKLLFSLIIIFSFVSIASCKYEAPMGPTWNGIPIYPGAKVDWVTGPHYRGTDMANIESDAMFLTTDLHVENVIRYYQTEMVKQGWHEDSLLINNDVNQSKGNYSKENYPYKVEIDIGHFTNGDKTLQATSIEMVLIK